MPRMTFGVWVVLMVVGIIAVGLAGGGLLGLFVPISLRWLIITAIILAFVVMVGQQIHGRFDGILIDSRFKLSLSRFQLVLWTVLVFSTYFAIALERNRLVLAGEVTDPAFNPLEIHFPAELLVALGISTASLAGAGIITRNKKESTSSRRLELLQDERTRYAREQQEAQSRINAAKQRVQQLAAEENRLRGDIADRQATLVALQERLPELDQAVTLAEQQAAANPDDALAAETLALARQAAAEARADIQRLEMEIRRTEAGIQAVQEQTRAAAQDEANASAIFERATRELARVDDATRNRAGVIYRNESPEQASWLDIFRGDEISNYQVVEVSKIQMFFFTLALVFTYGVLLWALMNNSELMREVSLDFPEFSDTLNALLGLSHAGYLVVKGAGGG